MKKLNLFLLMITLICMCFGVVACDEENNNDDTNNTNDTNNNNNITEEQMLTKIDEHCSTDTNPEKCKTQYEESIELVKTNYPKCLQDTFAAFDCIFKQPNDEDLYQQNCGNQMQSVATCFETNYPGSPSPFQPAN